MHICITAVVYMHDDFIHNGFYSCMLMLSQQRDDNKRNETNMTRKTTTTTTTRARKSRDNDATFTLVALARELGIDPKYVRARARKYVAQLNFAVAKHVYRVRDRARVIAIVAPNAKS